MALLFSVTALLFIALQLKESGVRLTSAVSIYLILFALLYILRLLFLALELDTPMPDDLFGFDYDPDLVFCSAMVAVWSASFYFTSKLMPGIGLGYILPKADINSISLNKLEMATLVLTFLNFSFVGFLILSYGFDVGLISYNIRLEKIFAGASFLLSINVFAAYLSATVSFLNFMAGRKRNFILFTFFALFNIAGSIFTADRDNIAFFLVFYSIGLGIFVSERLKLMLPLVGAGAAWLIIALQKLRLEAWGYDKEYSGFFRQVSSGLNHQFIDSFILLVHNLEKGWVSTGSFRYGLDFYLGAIGVVPRSLWPGKPEMVDPGIWFSTQFIPDATYGWPISVVGEWWLNFSVWGVAIGGCIAALILKGVDDFYHDAKLNPLALMLVFLIATRVFPLGLSTSSIMYYVLNVVPIIFILMMVRERS